MTLLTKSRIYTTVSNCHTTSKWSARWIQPYYQTTIKTTFNKNGKSPHFSTSSKNELHKQTTSGKSTSSTTSSSSLSSSSSSIKTGKFYKFKIRKYWSWKAGAGWTILSVLDWWLLAAGGWLTWRGVFLKWTPIGFCLVAAAQWHLHNKNCDKEGLPRTASKWQTTVYCSLPLRLISRGWGWLADCRIPIPLRPIILGSYSKAFGVNLDEAAVSDFKDYRSLAQFFTRSLKEDVRLIDRNSCLVSPADGRVLHFGLATHEQIEQVKGVTYSLQSFLGPDDWPKKTNESKKNYIDNIKLNNNKEETVLYQCIIYLAPGDYHRFHSPTEWQPKIRRHFSGELLSVSPKIANWLPGLFCLNERALYIGKWKYGLFTFAAIGATNVGSVQIFIDDQLKTNKWIGLKVGKHKHCNYDEIELPDNINLTKGELLGQFNLGSSVVLIFEAPKNFRFKIEVGQKVKMGESIGCINNTNNKS